MLPRSTCHRTCEFESLESRRFFAAALAPTTLNGLVLAMTITAGSGDFDDTGSFQFRASADDSSYSTTGSVDSSGTVAYTRTSANVGLARATDPAEGMTTNVTLTFASQTSGTFSANAANRSGSMAGTFTVAGTVRPLVVISNGVLTITGTIGDDTISIVNSGASIRVTENNFPSPSISAAAVTSMNLVLREGSDALVVGAGVLGFYCDAGPGNDNLLGGDGKDTITGGAGKDYIDGGLNDDRLNGSGSPDRLIGNAGADRLYGGDGDDFCEGGGGVDRIWGGNGIDILAGGGSNDKLFGEAGNDSLYGGTGSDILDGGADTDLAPNDGTDTIVNVP